MFPLWKILALWVFTAYELWLPSSQAPCLWPSQPWGNATASNRACALIKPISSTYKARLDICPHNCPQYLVMLVTRWYLAAHPQLQLNPLCQSIPCLMQARWISDIGWGKVGSAVITLTGLFVPLIPLADASQDLRCWPHGLPETFKVVCQKVKLVTSL